MPKPRIEDFAKKSPFPIQRYEVDVPWKMIEQYLVWLGEDGGLDLNPDFQRAHVWTAAQQTAFVEYMLLGGPANVTLYFACEGWVGLMGRGLMVLVDGKQRLEAIRRFMRNDLPIFGGHRLRDFADEPRLTRGGSIKVCVADIDRLTTLRWYVALNAGGTPHTEAELEEVRNLIVVEEEFP